ncbi:inositol monophosphatase family protein [Pyrobaculum ferrireducens]|uniref:Inositol monophosphatase n=1 Tax=Pyrobaculum ferrireducens TaxID=1104324 RepID=G7VHK7_9CREN|nr:inositol monophosphatase family protein [Pyrobaculum ferrireducens]AET33298.1 inositol monophosphatase [Pyrobaculum ferrireducens]
MIDVLARAVREGGRVAREMFLRNEGLEAILDRGVDVTRRADLAVQEAVLEVLRSELPSASVLTEESGWVRWGSGGPVVVVDPLDGSGNYVLGIPHFAVMAAAGGPGSVEVGDMTHAAVYLPMLDLLFAADPARGVEVNGSRWRRVGREDVVFVELGRSFTLEAVDAPRRLGYKVRSSGCAGCSILAVALGRAVGFIDVRGRLGPWDVAAPLVFGRSNPSFSYWLAGGALGERGRVKIIAGLDGFVERVRQLIPL